VVVVVNVTDVALRVQGVPPFWDTLTVPVKPLRAVTVIVEVPVLPTFATTFVGLAVIEKSGAAMTTLTFRECVRAPTSPVAVTR